MKKKITLDSLKPFLLASKTDLEEQQQQFEKQYISLIAAVDAAQRFVTSHKGEKSQPIIVIEHNGNIQHTGWEKTSPKMEGKRYRFDHNSDPDDPFNLGEYEKKRQQFILRIEDIDHAIALLQKLQYAGTRINDPIELLPITRVIDRHIFYLEDMPASNPKVKQQIEVLNAFLALLKKKEKSKGKVKRFFVGVKNKLKRNREDD